MKKSIHYTYDPIELLIKKIYDDSKISDTTMTNESIGYNLYTYLSKSFFSKNEKKFITYSIWCKKDFYKLDPSYNSEEYYKYNKMYIAPGDNILIPTGIKIGLTEGYCAQIISINNLVYNNSIKVESLIIDPTYRDEIQVLLYNFGKEFFEIKHGDCIAQLIIKRIEIPKIKIVDELPEGIILEGWKHMKLDLK